MLTLKKELIETKEKSAVVNDWEQCFPNEPFYDEFLTNVPSSIVPGF